MYCMARPEKQISKNKETNRGIPCAQAWRCEQVWTSLDLRVCRGKKHGLTPLGRARRLGFIPGAPHRQKGFEEGLDRM